MADHPSLAEATFGNFKCHLVIRLPYCQRSIRRSYSGYDHAGQEEDLKNDMVASLDVNVLGMVFSINAFLSLLRNGVVKKIIVISTGMADPEAIAVSGNSGSVTYSAMKAALNVIVAKYSQELKGEGFTVLALSPGLVNTREEPPTPEELEQLKRMIQQSKTYAADWNVPISPAESVDAMKKVIDEKGLQDTGAFLSHWGNNN